MRILVANDDPTLLRILERGLRAHGFEVVTVDSRRSAEAVLVDQSFELVLLDTSLVDFGCARGFVESLPTPRRPAFLLLTARQEDIARAETDSLAQDDYLLKPFALEELIGRIRAKTRPANERGASTLQAGDLRIDLMARCAWRGEKVIDLPVREFALLEYFMRHPRRVVSRADILTDVWGYNFASESNLVDVYVRYLRNRIDRPGERSLVVTVRGAGYRFDPPGDASTERIPPPDGVAHNDPPA